jgi:hypothetical protein
MSEKLTAKQLLALKWLSYGYSLRGYCHGKVANHLKMKGLIEDSDTLTDAGRAAIAKAEGRQP